MCANKARDVLPPALLAGAATDDADRPLTHRETKQLMMPLIRLRQACCHPQASAAPTSLRCISSLLQMPCAACGHIVFCIELAVTLT